MFWNILLLFFAAFGLLCALWAILGALLPGSKDCHIRIACCHKDGLPLLRRLCWLREMGLLRVRITVQETDLHPSLQRMIHDRYPYIHFMSNGKECPEHGSTGNGNFAGHHCRCDLPEL